VNTFGRSRSESADQTPSISTRTGAPAASIPSECIARVLNYAPYSDVRSSLLAGKVIAIDAARKIDTLNIVNPAGLNLRCIRRFVGVKEVNILCVVRANDQDGWPVTLPRGRGQDNQVIHVSSATMAVPFLSSFPKLERAFVGGPFCWFLRSRDPKDVTRLSYSILHCISPDHAAFYRGVIYAFCGSFELGTLPNDLSLTQVIGGTFSKYTCRENALEQAENPCELCRHICKCFPLGCIMIASLNFTPDLCLNVPDLRRVVMSRAKPGSFSSNEANRAVCELFGRSWDSARIHVDFLGRNGSNEAVDAFVTRVEELDVETTQVTTEESPAYHVNFIRPNEWERIENWLSFGFVPGNLRKEQIYEKLCEDGKNEMESEAWDHQTLVKLVSLGFDLDPADFMSIDREIWDPVYLMQETGE